MGAVAAALVATTASAAGAAPAKVVKLGDHVAPVGHPTTSTLARLALSTSLPAGDKVTKYSVTFGDVSHKLTVSKSTGVKVPTSVTHRYGRAGRYLVTFSLSDRHKHTVTATTHIIVAATALAGGGATGTTIAVGTPVRATPVTAPVDSFSLPVAPGTAGSGGGWGNNDFGQATGTAPTTVSTCRCAPAPGYVGGLARNEVASLAGGLEDGYALLKDGTVEGWGHNDVGELGNAQTVDSATPVRVGALTGINAIAAGTDTGYALKSDGTVWAWGDNANGELANGASGYGTFSATPAQIPGLSHVTAIAAGAFDAYALRDDGTVWGWGYNFDSELATSASTNDCTCVSAVNQISGLTSVTNKATAIGAGAFSGYAVLADGTVGGWGLNDSGQVGSGLSAVTSGGGPCDSACEPRPMRVDGVTGARAVAAGYSTGYALLANGSVWSWGSNTAGETGNGTPTAITSSCGCVPTPAAVPELTGITSLAATGDDAYALKGGTVFAWGDNADGETGNNSTSGSTSACTCVPTAKAVPGLTGVVSVGDGAGDTAFAVKAS